MYVGWSAEDAETRKNQILLSVVQKGRLIGRSRTDMAVIETPPGFKIILENQIRFLFKK